MNIGGKVYLGKDEIFVPSDPNAEPELIRLDCKDYNEAKVSTYSFFTNCQPDDILKVLIAELTRRGQTFQMSNQTWKLSFDLIKTINEEEIKQAAAGSAPAPVYERAKLQVEIFKVPNQNKWCVDFQRKGGSAILFYDNAGQYLSALEMYNNTTLDAEEDE